MGGEVGTGRVLLDALARGLAGGSSFGQPINNSGATRTAIFVNLANPVILSNKLSLLSGARSSCFRLPENRIKRLRSKRERLLDRRIKRFRHRDRFQLHQRRQLLPERQRTKPLRQLRSIVDRRRSFWSRCRHHHDFTVILELHLTRESQRLVQLFCTELLLFRPDSENDLYKFDVKTGEATFTRR